MPCGKVRKADCSGDCKWIVGKGCRKSDVPVSSNAATSSRGSSAGKSYGCVLQKDSKSGKTKCHKKEGIMDDDDCFYFSGTGRCRSKAVGGLVSAPADRAKTSLKEAFDRRGQRSLTPGEKVDMLKNYPRCCGASKEDKGKQICMFPMCNVDGTFDCDRIYKSRISSNIYHRAYPSARDKIDKVIKEENCQEYWNDLKHKKARGLPLPAPRPTSPLEANKTAAKRRSKKKSAKKARK